jgi:PhnB protein
MKIVPYMSFNGNCEEAVKFYQSVLGGELSIMRFKDLPPQEGMPISEAHKEKIMHAALTFDDGAEIYFSDTFEGSSVDMGTNNSTHLSVASEEEVYRIVKELAEGGAVKMPAAEMFWGAVFGNLVDKFGVHWSVDYPIPR